MKFARKIILHCVLSCICKLDTNLACGRKECKDDDCKDQRDLRMQARNEHCNCLELDIVFIDCCKTLGVYSPTMF